MLTQFFKFRNKPELLNNLLDEITCNEQIKKPKPKRFEINETPPRNP